MLLCFGQSFGPVPLNAALGGFKRRSLAPSQFRSGFWGHLGISFVPFTALALARREVGRGPEVQGGSGARCSPWRGHFPQAAPRALLRAGRRGMKFAVARLSLRAAGAEPRASRAVRARACAGGVGLTWHVVLLVFGPSSLCRFPSCGYV